MTEPPSDAADPADLLLRRGRLVPLTGAPAYAGRSGAGPVDVLVRRGVVAEIGPALQRLAGVEEYDADGRWLMPGLWDQHTHLGQWTLTASRLDLHGTSSPEEVLAVVGAAVAASPGTPLVANGHSAGAWQRPATVAELDAVTGDTPVVLINHDFHHGWLNTAALSALGLPLRDEVVSENEWYAAYPHLDDLVGRSGSSPAAYRAMLERTAALGVVGMVDFEFRATYDAWSARWAEGCDLLRIRAATYADGLDAVVAAGLRTGDPVPDVESGGRLTVGPLKIISDGSLGTRTAWCCEAYAEPGPDGAPSYGAPNQSPDELHDLLARATGAGLEVATHAIGDRAVGEALAAYAAAGARGSIEHAQLIRHEDVKELARLGLRASVQPAHLLDDRDVSERVWPGQGERCFAFRWMLDAGVTLALGSDAPVAPLDPWLAVSAAVHRTADDRDPWHPEQAITPREALAASVDGAGTVDVGSLGDLVVLDRDPLSCSLDELRTMGTSGSVALTVVGGRVVHRA
ncbi:amidohydrolase [Nocardioides cheoyonin]|uniref:amidohydrolase n=1 Tax=Nocardioides cheoyonin TaxID=3156615 RepID=UPI0032B5CC75